MKGNVCISARMRKAYEIQRWKTCSFSCETPVTSVIHFTLLAVALRDGQYDIGIADRWSVQDKGQTGQRQPTRPGT